MLHKTKGIVLKCTRYGESSVVMQVLTHEYGLQTYLINGVRKPKSKYSPSILQGLHLLDMVVYHKENGGIQRVSDVRNSPAYKSIPLHTVKSGLVMFMNEVLYKSISHGQADTRLFDFLYLYLLRLDEEDGSLANFLIFFLLDLSQELGFYPALPEDAGVPYFDLKDGSFSYIRPVHPAFIAGDFCTLIARVLIEDEDGRSSLSFSKAERKEFTSFLLQYFAFHIDNFGQIKSWEVLESVFD